MKIAVLSNDTMRGMEWDGPEWYFSEYAKCFEDALQEDSDLYKFKPDVILVSIDNFADLKRIISALIELTDAAIFVHNLVEITEKPIRFLHNGREVRSFNYRLDDMCAAMRPEITVQILDLEGLTLDHGRQVLFDQRMYFLAQRRFSDLGMNLMAGQFRQALIAKFEPRKKCLVVDLDNTIWGGLVADGVKIGPEFQAFQRSLKTVVDSGVILAICSKNDEEQALDIISRHPDMILDIEDFAAWRINWNDKPSNIREISEELNISLDSMVFLDDSEQEIAAVSAVLPDVTCYDLTDDPAYYCDFISKIPDFETFSVTTEDEKRSEMYTQERHRREASKGMDYNEFLKSLEIEICIEEMDDYSRDRVSQLSKRTNQFSMNGEAFEPNEIKRAYTVSYEDKFGSQGIVGAAILDGEIIAGLYMSCRILGRGVEQAFMSKLYPRPMITAETGKNKAAMDFLVNFQEGVPEWIEIESYGL